MYKNFVLAGSISGILGMLISFSAGLARVAGYYYVAGYEATTIFNVGVGLMVFACLIKLDALQRRNLEK